jgi:hypothetical protein
MARLKQTPPEPSVDIGTVPETLSPDPGQCSGIAKPDMQIEVSDPWALENMVASEDFSDTVGDRVIYKIKVGKPHRQDWIQVHPSKEYRRLLHVVELTSGVKRETYLVANPIARAVAEIIGDDLKQKWAYTYITKQGDPGLWLISIEGTNDWNQTALVAVQDAMKNKWVRVTSNMHAQAYEVTFAKRDYGPPKWTDHTFHELLKLGFREAFITNLDHPVIAQLDGS